TSVPEMSPKKQAVRSAALYHIDDRLTWRLEVAPRGTVLVDVATGKQRGPFTPEQAGRIGQRAFGGNAGVTRAEQIRDYKVFYSSARARANPPYLVTLDDPQSTELVVDASTGDIDSVMGTWERIYRIGRAPHILSVPPFDNNAELSNAFGVF